MNEPPVQPIAKDDPALQAFLANHDRNLFYGVHETWEAAQAAAESYGRTGYDNIESAAIYDFRLRIDQHDYPSLYWLTRSWIDGLRSVFDIGGAIGIKYIAFRDARSSFPGVTWRVCDVPAMAAHGEELARERGDSGKLTFTSRYEDGTGYDIVFASGVLQYLPRTLSDVVAGFHSKPRRIIINTAAIHPEYDFFTVNSIGTAFCPYRVQTQASVTRGLTKLGYRLRDAWINPDKPLVIPGEPARSLRHYCGYCFDLTPAR